MAGQEVEAFTITSYSQILQQRQGKAFILVLWSLDCPPCYRELALLGQRQKKYPDLELVLISTDQDATATEISQLLSRHALQQNSTWKFADEGAQRLRYSIDPQWYGELPRSYLFDAQHQRQAVSGVLEERLLEQWLKNHLE